MRRWLPVLLLLAGVATAQNPNPQQSYVQTVQARNPSMWVRFNEPSSPYHDSISGLAFSENYTNGYSGAPTSTNSNTGFIFISSDPLAAGNLTQVTLQHFVAPSSTCTETIVIGSVPSSSSSPNITIVNSFTLNVAPNTLLQTFHAGTDFSPVAVTAGEVLGIWVPSGTSCTSEPIGYGPAWTTPLPQSFYTGTFSTLPSGSVGYGNWPYYLALTGTTTAVGTLTARQPGFDSTLQNNYSVAFPYNSFLVAPNSSIGDLEWSNPWGVYVHINNFVYNQESGSSGGLTLLSKGNITNGQANLWALYINGNGLAQQVCFEMQGYLAWGPGNTRQTVCTSPGSNAVIPGYGLDIYFSHAGTGSPYDDQIYINGQPGGANVGGTTFNAQNNIGFGAVNVVTSGGSGYTDPTSPFTSSGGGPNCHVNGAVQTSGGVCTGSIGYYQNYGCTSVPSLVVSGTGTGCVASGTIPPTSISNTQPLIFGDIFGLSADPNQVPVNIDEAAILPVATNIDAMNLFYWTKFYQQILGAPPATPTLVLFDDDGAGDIDNEAASVAAVGLARAGYIKIVGAVSEDYSGSCPTLWSQMLQQAGLTNVPVGTAQTFSGGGTACVGAHNGITAYNASSPTASSAFVNSTVLYRTVFAKYSTTPIRVVIGGAQTALAAFMQSEPDGISSLTGLQLMSQNAANGGAIYIQGYMNCNPSSPPVPTPCTGTNGSISTPNAGYDADAAKYVYLHNGTTLIYFTPGTPQNTGGAVFNTRTSKDPFYLFSLDFNDNRPGWDTMALAAAVTNRFHGGIMVAASGGTGYATLTGITQSGGGSGCPSGVIGYMHASGGVPDDIYTLSGLSINTPSYGTYYGIGYNCTSLPTLSLVSPTGTGVTLTPYLNDFCATLSDTGNVGGYGTTTLTSSGSCATNVHVINIAPTAAVISDMPVFSYWSTSLIAPPPVPQPRLIQ